MPRPIRPTRTFILRLWREPDGQPGSPSWRGLLRSLEAKDATPQEIPFRSLESLPAALKQALAVEHEKDTLPPGSSGFPF